MCNDGMQCESMRCGYHHCATPVGMVVQQLQEMEDNIAKLIESNAVKVEKVDKTDFHKTDLDEETIGFAVINQDDHHEGLLRVCVAGMDFLDKSLGADEWRRAKRNFHV